MLERGYMAPKLLAQGRLTEKVDVYSFGVLVLEIVSGVKNSEFHPTETFETLVINVNFLITLLDTCVYVHLSSFCLCICNTFSLGTQFFSQLDILANCERDLEKVVPNIALVFIVIVCFIFCLNVGLEALPIKYSIGDYR